MTIYPCRDCIVKMLCAKRCYRLEGISSIRSVNKYMKVKKVCIDCGGVDCRVYLAFGGTSVNNFFILCMDCSSVYYIVKKDTFILTRIGKKNDIYPLYNEYLKRTTFSEFLKYRIW
jgi:hypothetical protein